MNKDMIEFEIKSALSYLREVNGSGCQEETCLKRAASLLHRALSLLEDTPRWYSVNDRIPPQDEEVIAFSEDESISFAHIVDKSVAVDYDGWNIPGVAFWMPFDMTEEMKEFYELK